MNRFKSGDNAIHVSYGEGEVKKFRGYTANPERDYDTEAKYDFLPNGDKFVISVFESELTPITKQKKNTVATAVSYLEQVAAHTPPEQVNILSNQFLDFAETVTSIHITVHPKNEQYSVIKKRYEDATGMTFPDLGDPDPRQGPKCDTLLSMEAALKSGYPVCQDKAESQDVPLYLTKMFDNDDIALVGGRRAGVVWALCDLGYVIGSIQDRNRIALCIAAARRQLTGGQ